jgi:anti-sigma regulatory factor (Ser/Thr protein kinase)
VVDELRLHLEAEARRLAEVRRAIREWLGAQRVDRPEDVVLAVDEAVANAIEHSGRFRTEPVFIDVVARSDGQSILVEVSDQGSWLPPHHDDSRGRGLNIIGELMDRVHVAATTTGTRITMHRSLER